MNIIFRHAGSLRFLKRKIAQIKPLQQFILLLFLLVISSCTVKFIPEINNGEELLVVQALITDQPEVDTIKLSKSIPLGGKNKANPVNGCIVKILDNMGNSYSLKEYKSGTYVTDPGNFKGEIGRFYTLQISTNNDNNNLTYESDPAEMKPVPQIDSVYYEKTVIEASYGFFQGINGCQIYLDTHDVENKCKFYRWDYSETWMLRLLFPVPNMICWISDNSDTINIKSTAAFTESRITRHPINYISNTTDRLKTKYSILVNQYSLNEDEYTYWENLQNLIVQVGGLSDIIPSSVPGNIHCIENPNERVLGYFSVSAKTSKRIFIKDNFAGIIDNYANCIYDTIYSNLDPPEMNVSEWTLIDHPYLPPYKVITKIKGCADCTVRGTNIEPDFWIDDK